MPSILIYMVYSSCLIFEIVHAGKSRSEATAMNRDGTIASHFIVDTDKFY